MSAFFEYISHITYYLIFMAIVGVVAPSGNYKKYIALVMGIMLIGIVVGPVTGLFTRDTIPVTELFANIMPIPMFDSGLDVNRSNHANWQYEQVKIAFHSQLTSQVKTLLMRNGYEIISAEWVTSEDFTYINQLFLQVKIIETAPTPVPFIRVAPVRVAPYQPLDETEENAEEIMEIKKLVSDFYNMSMDNIHVEIRY
ncbi:MAG: stage III sporulation protein AF [Defluviitaleaceae bacterium]|nr:stage III sporulation protein AF [Defluviitaleaceae bacterium]